MIFCCLNLRETDSSEFGFVDGNSANRNKQVNTENEMKKKKL